MIKGENGMTKSDASLMLTVNLHQVSSRRGKLPVLTAFVVPPTHRQRKPIDIKSQRNRDGTTAIIWIII